MSALETTQGADKFLLLVSTKLNNLVILMSSFCILCQGDQATQTSDEFYPVLVKTEHRSVLADPRDEKIDDLPRAETADRR